MSYLVEVIQKCIMNDGLVKLKMFTLSFSNNIHSYILYNFLSSKNIKGILSQQLITKKKKTSLNYIQDCSKKISDIVTKTFKCKNLAKKKLIL